jgi:hypothetical protein
MEPYCKTQLHARPGDTAALRKRFSAKHVTSYCRSKSNPNYPKLTRPKELKPGFCGGITEVRSSEKLRRCSTRRCDECERAFLKKRAEAHTAEEVIKKRKALHTDLWGSKPKEEVAAKSSTNEAKAQDRAVEYGLRYSNIPLPPRKQPTKKRPSVAKKTTDQPVAQTLTRQK